MTDDLARELEEVAGSVPPIPNDYATLRSLIQSLPQPIPPDIRSAVSGTINTADPGATASSQMANTMAGGQIGMESGAALGVVSELFYGASNLLTNPTMEYFTSETILTTLVDMGPGWSVKYVKNSGQDPASLWFESLYPRGDTADNPTNTDLIAVYIGSGATGAGDYTVYIEGDQWFPGDIDPELPYLVAAVKLTMNAYGVDTNTTLFRARMEITTNAGAGTLYYGPWLDLKAMATSTTVKRISCSMPRPTNGWSDPTPAPYLWRLRIDHAMSSATPTYDDVVLIAEPVFSVATTQAPLPFTPMLGKWEPHEVHHSLAGDVSNRIELGTTNNDPATGKGYLGFGSGSAGAPDAVIDRISSGLLRVSSSIFGSGDGGWRFGDDVVLLDVDVGNHIGLQGVQDATLGGIVFGSGKDTNLFRSGANELKTDDTFVIGDRLSIPSEIVSTVNADQNNFAPTGIQETQIIRFNSFTANRTVTGIAAGSGGDLLIVVNDTAYSLLLPYESTSSTDVNRFRTPNAATVTVRQRGAVILMYIGSRWSVIGSAA